MGDVEKLPDGYYWDDEEMLCDAAGKHLPDGLYSDEEGNLVMYEGNFLSLPLE
ncbi:MAG: hypothetical protein RR323_06165 [Raoultibacter sp.]